MEYQFAHYFGTNYIPSDEEVERIRTHLDPYLGELASIEEGLRDLAQRRDKLRDYIAPYKALISYPRRLPRDVVEEICLACLPTDRNAVMSAKEPPVLLGRICSSWRTIALSTPRLWASLHAAVEYISEDERRTSALAQWLERSAACPLSLSVFGDFSHWILSDSIPALLAGSATRWRNVKFSHFSKRGIQWLQDVETPLLESLHIDNQGIYYPVPAGLFKSQNLRSVRLWVDFLDPVAGLPIVWEQLTDLSLISSAGLPFQDVLCVLKLCPLLVSFEFNPEQHASPPIWFDAPVMLRFLESFCLPNDGNYVQPQAIGSLLEHLVMPQLRRFCVRAIESRSSETLATRSPRVEFLGIALDSTEKGSLSTTLHSFPFLKNLRVDVWDERIPLSHSLFPFLTPDPDADPSPPCPALEELILTECSPLSEETLVSLVSFLRRHVELGTTFRRLEIGFGCPEGPSNAMALKTAIDPFLTRGLEISLKFVTSHNRASAWSGL